MGIRDIWATYPDIEAPNEKQSNSTAVEIEKLKEIRLSHLADVGLIDSQVKRLEELKEQQDKLDAIQKEIEESYEKMAAAEEEAEAKADAEAERPVEPETPTEPPEDAASKTNAKKKVIPHPLPGEHIQLTEKDVTVVGLKTNPINAKKTTLAASVVVGLKS